MLDTNLIFNSISATGLLVASIYTIKNYYFIKNAENENHFYKYKMESAQKLLVAALNLINEFQEIISDTNDLKEQKKINELVNENIDKSIDSSFDKFRKTVIENCLFLPQNIIDEIESFYDMFLVEIDFKNNEEEIEKYFDQLLDKIESIAELIRTDLGVEKINIKLKKRLK